MYSLEMSAFTQHFVTQVVTRSHNLFLKLLYIEYMYLLFCHQTFELFPDCGY